MVDIVRLGSGDPSSYFQASAHLHIAEIHHGVLPLLGEDFLTRLYYEVAVSPMSGVWVGLDAGRVLGFIAGSADISKTYWAVVSRAGFSLGRLAMKGLLQPDAVGRIPALLGYPFHRDQTRAPDGEQKVRAELLAIAIARESQRRGIGRALVRAFENALLAWGINGPYQVATNLAESDSNAFYQNLGFLPCDRIKHHRLVLQVYRKEIRESSPSPEFSRQ